METRQLYGGAITMSIPVGFMDASLLREIPDTQEVYVNDRKQSESQVLNDGLGLESSVVIDLLERVESQDPLQVHIEEILRLNDVPSNTVKIAEKQRIVTETLSDAQLTVVQLDNSTKLCIGLLRLGEFATDVLVTLTDSLNTKEPIRDFADSSRLISIMKSMLESFKVIDSKLFG